MSLDKAIKHKKEKRKPYRGSKAISKRCRTHTGCPACEGNRMHGVRKKEQGMSEQEQMLNTGGTNEQS